LPLRRVDTQGGLSETRQIKSKEKGDLVFELEQQVFGNAPSDPVEAHGSDGDEEGEDSD